MGKFDGEIGWLRERRQIALGDLDDFRKGARQFRNDRDITQQLVDRATQDIEKFDMLIAGYGKHNA